MPGEGFKRDDRHTECLNQERSTLFGCAMLALVLRRRVLGVDATAAQTLGSLVMVLRRIGVELIITRVTNPSIRRLLVAHGIISGSDTGEFVVCIQQSGCAIELCQHKFRVHAHAQEQHLRLLHSLRDCKHGISGQLVILCQCSV